jgi:hypothetical protein
VTNGYGTESESTQVVGRYAGKLRTYVIEWAPKHVRMTVDGKQIHYSTRSFKGARWLGLVASTGDVLTGVPDARTKLPAKLLIDQVKIWSYTGVPPKAGVVTPTPSPSPATAATSAPTATVTSPGGASAETGPALAGGVWPWLLGGSLIAVSAIIILNFPNYRRRGRTGPALRH